MRQPQGNQNDPPDEKNQSNAAKSTVRQPGAPPGVLVVDDEHQVRVMIQLCLERIGFAVWLARNGREAIKLFRQHRDEIDVVLLDVRMPHLDGPHTLQVLRKINPDVRACFMCDDTGVDTPEELCQHSNADCIAKPFRLDALATIFRPMIRGVPTELLPPTEYGPNKNSQCGDDDPIDVGGDQ